MSITSVDDVKVAADSSQASQVREEAISYLADHPTEQAIGTLIDLMETDDAGVRWKAADALAFWQDRPRPGAARWTKRQPLAAGRRLSRLPRQTLFEVARMTDGVCAAMKGQGAALATVTAAGGIAGETGRGGIVTRFLTAKNTRKHLWQVAAL